MTGNRCVFSLVRKAVGSVIGPLMFLIYINDLAMLLSQYKVKRKLFADDVKLCVRVVSDADVTELQMALSAVTSWAEYWQLSESVDKCGVTYYTTRCCYHICYQ